MTTQKFVARRVLKIGDQKIAPGQNVPEGLDRGRLLRMMANNEIVPAGSLEAPDPVPNEHVNPQPAEDGAESPSPSGEESSVEADADTAGSSDAAADSDEGTSEFPKHVGAGTWELSDGARISKDEGGKDAALQQQALLDALDADEVS